MLYSSFLFFPNFDSRQQLVREEATQDKKFGVKTAGNISPKALFAPYFSFDKTFIPTYIICFIVSIQGQALWKWCTISCSRVKLTMLETTFFQLSNRRQSFTYDLHMQEFSYKYVDRHIHSALHKIEITRKLQQLSTFFPVFDLLAFSTFSLVSCVNIIKKYVPTYAPNVYTKLVILHLYLCYLKHAKSSTNPSHREYFIKNTLHSLVALQNCLLRKIFYVRLYQITTDSCQSRQIPNS